MKKCMPGCLGAICAAIAYSTPVAAQESGPLPVVEIFTCNFIGNSDMDDLMAVANRWNAWADSNEVTDYTAIIMTPMLYSDQVTFDVAWLGAWPNGAAMGAGELRWLSEGGDVQARFDEVVDCASHAQFAELPINTPEGGPPEQNGLALFENCALQQGRIVDEAIGAVQEWTSYVQEMGHDGFAAMLFPIAGESPEAEYSFKWVEGYDSPEAYGRAVDIYSGGGFRRAEELFGRLLECDSPRVYAMTLIRAPSAE